MKNINIKEIKDITNKDGKIVFEIPNLTDEYAILIFSLDKCPGCDMFKNVLKNIEEDSVFLNMDYIFCNISKATIEDIKYTEKICFEKLSIKKVPNWFFIKKEDGKFTTLLRKVGSVSYQDFKTEISSFLI